MSDMKRYLVEDTPTHQCHEKSSSEELRNSLNRDPLQTRHSSQEGRRTTTLLSGRTVTNSHPSARYLSNPSISTTLWRELLLAFPTNNRSLMVSLNSSSGISHNETFSISSSVKPAIRKSSERNMRFKSSSLGSSVTFVRENSWLLL